ncbi:MAG: CHASE3 domain-containing protein [Acetobacteraceae bacterium]|nr:CHASE3 domain-containing protein [Acetobacteraceae bacterium]
MTLAGGIGLLATALFLLGIVQLPRQQREASRWVDHTLEVLARAATLQADLATVTSEGRGFLVDQTTDGVRRFDAASQLVAGDLAALRVLTADNPVQQGALDRLDPLVMTRIIALREIVERAQAGDGSGAMGLARTLRGRVLTDQILAEVEGMKAEEQRLLTERGTAALGAANRTIAGLIACAFIMAASLFLTVALLVSRSRARAHLTKLRESERRLRTAAAEAAALAAEREATLGQLTEGVIVADRAGRIVFVNEAAERLHGVKRLHVTPGEYGETDHLLTKDACEPSPPLDLPLARATLRGETVTDARWMVSQVGLDGARLDVSPAAARVFGASPEALLEEALLARVVPDDRPNTGAFMRRLLAGEVEEDSILYRATHPARGEVWLEATGRLLRDPATGAPGGYIAVTRDVTERKRLEETLQHGQKMEAIGRIAAGVAHDFNNILQSVMGGLELVLDEVETGTPAHGFADVAIRAASRGAYLTHHLLAYARKQALSPRAVDLAAFLAEMRTFLARTLGPHIAIEVCVDRATPPVEVDSSQLQTAVLNLAINAAHAMPRGGTLSLGVCEESAAGQHWIVLAVSDTGVGMDAATLAQACEPFFTTKGLEGTGLGLSMVQGFAEQSRGRLHIASTPGEGTTVELRLPPAAADARPEAPQPGQEAPRAGGRVLLVDDDPDVLVTTEAFLDRAGFQVVRASSGDEALALLARDGERFDALVSDYAMPGLNGAALAVDSQAVQPGLPVLVITGFADVKEAVALPEGTVVLHKPFPREHLITALRGVLRRDTEVAERSLG